MMMRYNDDGQVCIYFCKRPKWKFFCPPNGFFLTALFYLMAICAVIMEITKSLQFD